MKRIFSSAIQSFALAKPWKIAVVFFIMALGDFFALYLSSKYEGVLNINGGIGFFQNYGLWSTLVGNALIPVLIKLYLSKVNAIFKSGAVTASKRVKIKFRTARKALILEGQFAYIIYIWVILGLLAWLSNTGIHMFGNPGEHWAASVFDSIDHKASFLANRINNFYTWCFLVPFCIHIFVFSTYMLVSTLSEAFKTKQAKYDLLHPDRSGGFGFLEHSRLLFNFILAVFLIQIAAHSGTFKLNPEHVVAYLVAVLVLIYGNSIFMGDIFTKLTVVKEQSINEYKEKSYADDSLSFEILKYFFEVHQKTYVLSNGSAKLLAMFISIVIKFLPIMLTKAV